MPFEELLRPDFFPAAFFVPLFRDAADFLEPAFLVPDFLAAFFPADFFVVFAATSYSF